jgi:HEAT repeat protein
VRVEAVSALIYLREQARPALPALVVLMDSDDPQLALLAMMATLGAGPDAAPCLMKGLTNRFADVRNEAAGSFTGDWGRQFPEHLRPAMPLLTNLLDDPDEHVRMNITNGLKYFDQEPPDRVHQH